MSDAGYRFLRRKEERGMDGRWSGVSVMKAEECAMHERNIGIDIREKEEKEKKKRHNQNHRMWGTVVYYILLVISERKTHNQHRDREVLVLRRVCKRGVERRGNEEKVYLPIIRLTLTRTLTSLLTLCAPD